MGSQGTVQTAMAGGMPILGIPLHPEQELNVHLAVRTGMGLAVAPRHAPSEATTAMARRILGSTAYRKQARRVRGLFESVDGAGNAAVAILRYLAMQSAGAVAAAQSA